LLVLNGSALLFYCVSLLLAVYKAVCV